MKTLDEMSVVELYDLLVSQLSWYRQEWIAYRSYWRSSILLTIKEIRDRKNALL